MRLWLALMAVLALLISPVSAAAAQGACAQTNAVAMTFMNTPEMAGMAQAGDRKAAADPCCHHGAKHPMDQKTCTLACATSCAVTSGLVSPVPVSTLVHSASPLNPAGLVAVHPYEPAGLIRPPKSMA